MLSFSGSTCQLGALSPMADPEVPASTSTSASMALFSLGTQTCAPPSLLLPRRAPSLQAPALDARPQAIVPVHLSAARTPMAASLAYLAQQPRRQFAQPRESPLRHALGVLDIMPQQACSSNPGSPPHRE
ncbi:hypothetical protein ZEAMMB73_Zm00001d030099 [Zea mays]|uniref:Uncharacterized protein n=1 Tax=Zea mays TaxID=4577 RepID=A0A1D6K9J0_MAIZE|nr:hypothetical protein ZEAMMB73_Zm00001d030099 [Zea mays]